MEAFLGTLFDEEKRVKKHGFRQRKSIRSRSYLGKQLSNRTIVHRSGLPRWLCDSRTYDCFSGDPSLSIIYTKDSGRPDPRSYLYTIKGEVRRHTDAQAGILLAEASSAICVQRFDGSRIVQITLRIAFRCVLHRCESQDIHC